MLSRAMTKRFFQTASVRCQPPSNIATPSLRAQMPNSRVAMMPSTFSAAGQVKHSVPTIGNVDGGRGNMSTSAEPNHTLSSQEDILNVGTISVQGSDYKVSLAAQGDH